MSVEISVVVPVFNEVDNVEPLAQEVAQALKGCTFELLFIDDGSTDRTAEAVLAARQGVPEIRLLRHLVRSGQSAAVCTGVEQARGTWVATLDGDMQNDPADIVHMLVARDMPQNAGVRLIMGNRKLRQDTRLRRLQSRIANGVRSRLLGDATPDTGCGIKLMHRETFLRLPRFDHMHRFLPALYQREGEAVISVPVGHRVRTSGRSKYGMLDRLWVGIVDLFGVMWLQRRRDRVGLQVREEE